MIGNRLMTQLSHIAWAHINLLGRCVFVNPQKPLDFKAFMKNLRLIFDEDYA